MYHIITILSITVGDPSWLFWFGSHIRSSLVLRIKSEVCRCKKISNLSVIDSKCVNGTVIQFIGCGTGLSVYNKQSWLHNTTNIRKETCRLNANHYPMKITTVSQSVGIFSNNSYDYTPPSKSLASRWLAGQLVVIPPLKWPYFQEYHTEYFKIPYDKY